MLVVDDDDSIREFITWVLVDEGHLVTTAANGAIALRLLEELEPDVILLDMRMPVMDGPQFAGFYREGRDRIAPIVVMTAAQDASRRAREIDAEAHLGKPFQLDELLAALRPFEPAT